MMWDDVYTYITRKIDCAVITSTDSNRERKLALQVKHNLTFSDSASNTIFARVIDDCWKTFSSSLGWQFNQDTDRIGIGLGVYQTKIDKDFQPLLELARASKDSSDFLRKVSLPAFSSKEKSGYLQIIRNLLSKSKGDDVTEDELWKFLRCLVVIHFDLENAGSRDSVHCWNRLRDQLENRDEGQAKLLFNTLTSIVAEYARSAGSIDASTLRAKIPSSITLKEYLNFTSDLTKLREHTDLVLESIHDTIGGKVRLPRNELLDLIETSINEKEVVVITGEPMMGKSVLLKLLANRLKSEGGVIALSVERLSGTTIENFLHNIHIQNDFRNIIFATGTAPLRCILIDGLERVRGDEDRRRVLNDLITEVRKYNKSIISKGGHRDNCWKIIFTCRALDAIDVLRNLETRKNLADNSLEMVKVGSLSDDEVAEVVDQLPKLKELASQGHLKEILSLPLILDLLTRPDIPQLASEEIPPVLTETWLLDWFWKEVVRLGDGLRSGKGNPDTRERLLINIARQSLKSDNLMTVSEDMDFEAVSGLVSDRLLIREDNHIRFAHEVYEDWTLTILLKHHNRDVPGFLTEIGEPLRLVRAFRLYASRLLEVEQTPNAWSNLLTALEGKDTLSPRWYQIALTAPLFSPLLKELLPRIQPCLFENDAALMSKFLKALRTICVQPSPNVYTTFGDLPPAELEKYLAYWTIPIWTQWAPVIQLVLQNPGVINDEVAFEFSHIAEKWMTNTKKNQLFRKEIANLSLKILNDGLLQTYEDEPRSQYIKSVLWAADCLPDQIDDFVKQKALGNRENKNRGFEELILNEGWIPLCRHLPKTAVEVLEAILCEKLEPDELGRYHHLFMDLGIGFTKWIPPTYLKGPFIGLLRLHPSEGLELIHRVTNHTTRCWKLREVLEHDRKPIPQIVELNSGSIEVWGDEHVFCWYRFPSVAPDAVTCALMALEYWMNEQLKKGADPQELFEKVLQDTDSVAVVGVCLSVALTNQKLCHEAIIPILENPAFWIMDVRRFTQDMTAESSTSMFSNYFSLGNDKADYKILLNLAKQPHRKLNMRSFVLPILLSGSENAHQRLHDAMRSFPDNPPFLYEDEKKNDSLVQERIETCKIWAAQTEQEKYEAVETDVEGQIGIQFKLPTELEEEQKEKLKPVEELNTLYGLQGWSMNLLDKGEIGQTFTIQSAMEYAQDLVRQDDPSYQPMNFLEYSEQRANAIAAFAAALVIHQWQWVEKNNYASWCREQLLIATKRHEPPARSHDDVSRFSMGYRRYAARALPILILKYPKDRRIREAIFALAAHRNDEVRTYLFNGLKTLWATDQKTIWKCINIVIGSSRKKAVDHKFWYLKEEPNSVTLVWGKYAGIKKINEEIKKATHLFLDQLYQKPIRNCLPNEIDSHHLQSLLHCLPSDNQITKIPSSNKLVDRLEELLLFTINIYIHFEKENEHYNKWAHNDWNRLFFPIITNALLRLPQNIAEPKLFDPIVNNWEKSPAVMEEFLREFCLVGPQPELEDRFIELWLDVGDRILSSVQNKTFGYHLNREMREILGLLIFADPTGIVQWNVQEWAPLKKMTPFISRWCDTVGDHPDCFPSLVRLLKSIGFSLMPEFGIRWLHDCILKEDDYKNFFERSEIVSSLAELLYDSWSKQKPSIKQDPNRLKHFAFLVDKVAEQGESIAIRLQSLLQETIYDK
ncbi:MAG: hypothetical protein WBE22_04615 [Halobacteriota archaeon]